MSDVNTAPTDVGANGGAVSPPVNGTPPADAGGKGNGAGEALWNKHEVVELRKEQRETRDLVKALLAKMDSPQPPPAKKDEAPADSAGVRALAELEGMKAVSAFRESLDGLDLDVSAEQRRNLQELYEAKRGSITDVAAWVSQQAQVWGLKKRGAQAPASATPSPAMPTTRGDAAPNTTPVVPTDIATMATSEIWKGMSQVEKDKWWSDWERENHLSKNRYAARRRPRKT